MDEDEGVSDSVGVVWRWGGWVVGVGGLVVLGVFGGLDLGLGCRGGFGELEGGWRIAITWVFLEGWMDYSWLSLQSLDS